MINLDVFASLAKDSSKIRTNASISDTKVTSNSLDLMDRALVNQNAGDLLLTCDNNAILGSDTEASLSVANSSQRITDLGELSRGTESG